MSGFTVQSINDYKDRRPLRRAGLFFPVMLALFGFACFMTGITAERASARADDDLQAKLCGGSGMRDLRSHIVLCTLSD